MSLKDYHPLLSCCYTILEFTEKHNGRASGLKKMREHRDLHGNAKSLASCAPHNIQPGCWMDHVQTTKSLSLQNNADPSQKVAIIGIGCRFSPNVNSPEGFWELISGTREDEFTAPHEQFMKDEDVPLYSDVRD